jgi:hypothetical protein
MSPLRLTGSTSGYSQLDAPAIAGDQTFTLPSTGGTLDRLNRAGNVLQVQNVYHTSTTQLTSSGALHELTSSLRIAFTPISAASMLYLECFGSFVSPNSSNLQYAVFYDVTNSTYVNLPPASGSRQRAHWFNRTAPFDTNDASFMYFAVPVSSGSTTARTYTVYHSTEGSVIQFLSSTLSSSAGSTYPLVFKITEVAQ